MTLGWSYLKLSSQLSELCESIQKSIPISWQTNNKGDPIDANFVPKFHVTFISKLNKKQQSKIIDKAKEMLAIQEPFILEKEHIFFEKVERISKTEVYCLGISLQAVEKERFLLLKQELAKSVDGTIFYGEHLGHISIAYIQKQHVSQFQELQSELEKKLLQEKQFQIQSIIFEFDSQPIEIQLKNT